MSTQCHDPRPLVGHLEGVRVILSRCLPPLATNDFNFKGSGLHKPELPSKEAQALGMYVFRHEAGSANRTGKSHCVWHAFFSIRRWTTRQTNVVRPRVSRKANSSTVGACVLVCPQEQLRTRKSREQESQELLLGRNTLDPVRILKADRENTGDPVSRKVHLLPSPPPRFLKKSERFLRFVTLLVRC